MTVQSCYHCNIEFYDLSKFKKHCSTEKHKKKEERLARLFKLDGKCPHDKCEFKSDNLFALEKHLTTHKQHRCITCDIVFDNRSDLNNHLEQLDHSVKLMEIVNIV